MATATLNFNYRGTGNKFLNLPKLAEAAFTAIISRSAVRRVAATPYSIPEKEEYYTVRACSHCTQLQQFYTALQSTGADCPATNNGPSRPQYER